MSATPALAVTEYKPAKRVAKDSINASIHPRQCHDTTIAALLQPLRVKQIIMLPSIESPKSHLQQLRPNNSDAPSPSPSPCVTFFFLTLNSDFLLSLGASAQCRWGRSQMSIGLHKRVFSVSEQGMRSICIHVCFFTTRTSRCSTAYMNTAITALIKLRASHQLAAAQIEQLPTGSREAFVTPAQQNTVASTAESRLPPL